MKKAVSYIQSLLLYQKPYLNSKTIRFNAFLEHMIFRFLLSINPIQQITAQKNPKCAQPGENNCKRKTDLTEQLKWLITVIPDSPAQPFIDDYSCDKLSSSHEYRAPKYLHPKWITPFYCHPLYSKKQQTKSSKQKHRPMQKNREKSSQTCSKGSLQASIKINIH